MKKGIHSGCKVDMSGRRPGDVYLQLKLKRKKMDDRDHKGIEVMNT